MAIKPTPLPKLQLAVTVLIQASEGLSATVIFPFVPQFVQDTGITGGDERKTGYYAGILESIFFVAEFASVYTWSRASDIFGRRPILLLGPLGLGLTLVGFGFSETFAGLVFWRCAQGVFNGNIGAVKTVMAEMSDSTNLAQAMSFIPIAWSSGTTLGPILGGLLSAPSIAERFQIDLLKRHPYFLPCAAVGLICFGIFLLGFVGLKEVHRLFFWRGNGGHAPAMRGLSRRPKRGCSPTLLSRNTRRSARMRLGPWLQTKTTECLPFGSSSCRVCSSRCSTMLSSASPRPRIKARPRAPLSPRPLIPTHPAVLFPLMYATSISLGGLGMSPSQIGVIRGVWGVFNTLFQLLAAPRIIRRIGPRKAFIAAYSNFVVCFGAYPVLSLFAQRAGRVDPWVWSIIVLQGVSNLFISMSYASVQMYIVTSSPRPAALSATNSLGQMVSTVLRGLAPFVASALFAISLERGEIAGGQLVYVILLGIVAVGMYTSMLLPKQL
ncbi:Protein ZINC INDUCED FACILITATOR-LIKE 1 [Mycena kentingensis (nom. inval.)]|nr:Protein ZINC INDUCED FACILITATOR-LIKE 1 [Mycena kentingensis (nom. inval.)]